MVKWPTSHTRSACSRFWSAWGRCQPLRRTTRGACRNIRATVGKIAIMPPKPTAEAGRRASLTAIAGLADTQVTVTRKMDIQETGMRIAREPAAAAQRGLPRSPKGLLRDHGSRSSARSGRHAVMARLPKATGRTADTVVTPRITPGAAVPIRGTTCHRLSLRSICTDGNTENFHRSRAQNASTALNVCKCSLTLTPPPPQAYGYGQGYGGPNYANSGSGQNYSGSGYGSPNYGQGYGNGAYPDPALGGPSTLGNPWGGYVSPYGIGAPGPYGW